MKAKLRCDLAARDRLKKASAKSSIAWHLPRITAKVSQMAAMLGTASWVGANAFSVPGSPQSPAGSQLACLQASQALRSSTESAYTAHLHDSETVSPISSCPVP